jgi:hypothetical protein
MPAGVMTKFRIEELSGVDKPAQEGAVVAIMKRDSGAPDDFDPVIKRAFTAAERQRLAESGAALPDGSYPIEDKADLRNAIDGIGRAKDEAKAKAHILARAKALGVGEMIPEAWTADPDGDGDEDGADTDGDAVAKAMILRGADLRKMESTGRPSPQGGQVDWAAKRAQAVSDLNSLAKAKTTAHGVGFEKAYSMALAERPDLYALVYR